MRNRGTGEMSLFRHQLPDLPRQEFRLCHLFTENNFTRSPRWYQYSVISPCYALHTFCVRCLTESLGETNDLAMTSEMEMHDTEKKNSSTSLDTQRNVVDCNKDGEKERK